MTRKKRSRAAKEKTKNGVGIKKAKVEVEEDIRDEVGRLVNRGIGMMDWFTCSRTVHSALAKNVCWIHDQHLASSAVTAFSALLFAPH